MNTREPAVFSTKSQNLSKKRPEQQSEESTDEFPDFQSMLSVYCPICFELLNPSKNIFSQRFSEKLKQKISVLTCSECKLRVHNYCYGSFAEVDSGCTNNANNNNNKINSSCDIQLINSDSNSNNESSQSQIVKADFLCDICKFEGKEYSPICKLCGNSDQYNRAFRKIDSENCWVHFLCALTSKRMFLTDLRTMQMRFIANEDITSQKSNNNNKPNAAIISATTSQQNSKNNNKTTTISIRNGWQKTCVICSLTSDIEDLVKCEFCPSHAHHICIFIEQILTNNDYYTWWFPWFKFCNNTFPLKHLLSMGAKPLFKELCQNFEQSLLKVFGEYQENFSFFANHKQFRDNFLEKFHEIFENLDENENNSGFLIINRGFQCKKHSQTQCSCKKPWSRLDKSILCEYCNVWFHEICLENPRKREPFLCQSCEQMQLSFQQLLEIFNEKREFQGFAHVSQLCCQIQGKYSRILDFLLLANSFEGWMQNIQRKKPIGLEDFRVFIDFTRKIPLNFGIKLLNLALSVLYDSYSEGFLKRICENCDKFVKPCVIIRENRVENVDFEAIRQLEALVNGLKALKKPISLGNAEEVPIKNQAIAILEEIFNEKRAIANAFSQNSEISEDLLEVLRGKSAENREIAVFLEFYQEKISFQNEILKDLRLIIEKQEKFIENLMENPQNLTFSHEFARNLLEKLEKFQKIMPKNANLTRFTAGFAESLDKIVKIEVFKAQEHLEDPVFLKMISVNFTEKSTNLVFLLQKWVVLKKELAFFEKMRAEVPISQYIFKAFSETERKNGPLFQILADFSFETQPICQGKPVFKRISLKNLRRLTANCQEIIEKLPFLRPKLKELRDLLDETEETQLLLQEIYENNETSIEFSYKSLRETLKKQNIFLPIFKKFRKIRSNSLEMHHLAHPSEALSEILRKMSGNFAKNTVKQRPFATFLEIFTAKVLAKRFLRISKEEFSAKEPDFFEFCKSFMRNLLQNLRLFKEMSRILLGNHAKTMNCVTRFHRFSEDLRENTNKLQVFVEISLIKSGFCWKNPGEILENFMENHTNFLEKCHFFLKKTPNLTILSREIAGNCFEIHWGHWLSLLYKGLTSEKGLNFATFQQLCLCFAEFSQEFPEFREEKLRNSTIMQKFTELQGNIEALTEDYARNVARFMEKTADVEEVLASFEEILRKFPVKMEFFENNVANWRDLALGSLKAKQILSKISQEKKQISLNSLETLHFFFQESQISPPFSQEIAEKIAILRNLDEKTTTIRLFFKRISKNFESFCLKVFEPELVSLQNSRKTSPFPVILLQSEGFKPQCAGFLEFYEKSGVDYAGLKELLELFSAISTDCNKTQRGFLQEIKRRSEEFALSVHNYLEKDFVLEVLDPSLYYFKTQIANLLSLRTVFLRNKVVFCQGIQKLAIYEWTFFANWACNHSLWLLNNEQEVLEIESFLEKLQRFLGKHKEPLVLLSESSEFLRLIASFRDVFAKKRDFFANDPIFRKSEAIFGKLSKKYEQFQRWSNEDLASFKRNLELSWKNTPISMIKPLENVIQRLFHTRLFDKNSLLFLLDCVQASEDAQTLITSRKPHEFTEKTARNLCIFLDSPQTFWLRTLLSLLICRLKRAKKGNSRAFHRNLRRFYHGLPFKLKEIDEFLAEYEEIKKSVMSLYKEFQQFIRKSQREPQLLSELAVFKQQLLGKVPVQLRFIAKFQSFWLEILENQVVCLKAFCLDSDGRTFEKKLRKRRENVVIFVKNRLTFKDLREIMQEKQGLSKPSRDFIGEFVRKCKDLQEICKRYPQIEEVLDLNSCESAEKTNKYRLKSAENHRRSVSFLLIRAEMLRIPGVSKEKALSFAKFIEKRAFFQGKTEYLLRIEEIRKKLREIHTLEEVYKFMNIPKKLKDQEIVRHFFEEWEKI